MEITDVSSGARAQPGKQSQTSVAVAPRSEPAPNSAASVSTISRDPSDSVSSTLNKANTAISALNIAQSATSEITDLVKSISGIVDQASKPDVPANRLSALQNEANQLVDAIKTKADVSLPDSTKPLAGDAITLDAQNEIGQTVKVALPANASQAFGINNINFSKSDTVSNARAQVANAQQQLAALNKSVNDSTSAVHSAVARLDVALQNTESSKSTVRDVSNAVSLAKSSRLAITQNHTDALSAHSSLNASFKELLE